MKMEKYTTRKKIDTEISEFIDYVKQFTSVELYELMRKSTGELIYSPDDQTYVLGRYSTRITPDGLWKVVTVFGETEHVFCNKQASLLYALALIRSQFRLASRLKESDQKYLFAKTEFLHYKQRLSSQNKKDEFKSGLYAAKLTTAKSKLIHARSELEKSLEMAKYLKLGN